MEAAANGAPPSSNVYRVPSSFERASDLATRRWPRELGRVRTGLRTLDRRLGGGYLPGSCVIVGGRTNVGKSFATLMMLANHAEQVGSPAAYASLEDPPREVARRVKAYAQPLLWVSFPDPRLSALLRLMHEAHDAGARLFAVDYVQLVEADGTSPWSAPDEIRRVLQRLKLEARRLDMVVLFVSQTRRPPDIANVAPFPSLYELAESSSIERQSEVVLMLGEDGGRVGIELAKVKGARRGGRIMLTKDEGTGALSEPTVGDDELAILDEDEEDW